MGLKVRQNQVCTFENKIMSYFEATKPEIKIVSCFRTETREKKIASKMMVIATIIGLFLKQCVVIYILLLSI